MYRERENVYTYIAVSTASSRAFKVVALRQYSY